MTAPDHFLVELDDAVRPLSDPEEITFTAAKALGQHLSVNRCAYATVEEDQNTFLLTGNYHDGVASIVGRYTFRQFGEECLRLMRAGEPYVVTDSETDHRVTDAERPSYRLTAIRGVVCVPISKEGRFVAAMAVHTAGPRAWQPDEVALVRRVAGRCWESIERARVTQSLKESEHIFRALANSIANLAWMAAPDGAIYWYNEQWYAYTGTTPSDVAGWGWQRVHDPAMLPQVKQLWQESIATGKPFEMVFPLRGADGAFRRFLTRVNPVRDSRGQVAHWFGTNTDVEDERLATEANAVLRERERRAREEAELQKRLLYSLFMQAPTLIAVLRGPDHVVELANPPICKAWGHAEGEVLNRPLFHAMPELRDQGFQSLLDGVYQTGVTHVGKETPAHFQRAGGVFETALRVLVVDDNADGAEMLAAFLDAKGYQTRVAYDGPGALRVAAEFQPELAFLDIGLPVMDGYELAARLRELPGLGSTRLVALTGYGQESDRRKTQAAGFQYHLVKPVDFEAIEDVVSDRRPVPDPPP